MNFNSEGYERQRNGSRNDSDSRADRNQESIPFEALYPAIRDDWGLPKDIPDTPPKWMRANSRDEIECRLRKVKEVHKVPIGSRLAKYIAKWAVWKKPTGISGPTGDWHVTFFRSALAGRVPQFVQWAIDHPSPYSDLALKGIRMVYDFRWPHNASAGDISYGLWGWVQLELRKPGESRPGCGYSKKPQSKMRCVECSENLSPNEELFCCYCLRKIVGQEEPDERIKNLLPVSTVHHELNMTRTSMVGIFLGEPFYVSLPEGECKDSMIEAGDCWVDLGDEQYMVQGVNPLGERVFVYGKNQLVESVVVVIPPEESTKLLLAMTADCGFPSSLSEDGNEATWTLYDEAFVPHRIVLKHHLEDGKNGHFSITT